MSAQAPHKSNTPVAENLEAQRAGQTRSTQAVRLANSASIELLGPNCGLTPLAPH
jgi:hypothetical protein